MSYNPKANVWAGPSPNSGYTVKMDAMKETHNALFESTIKYVVYVGLRSFRFYSTFKEEWRTNERVMLVLGMIVLFKYIRVYRKNTYIFSQEVPGLHNPAPVIVQNRKYRAILKRFSVLKTLHDHISRLLYTLCNQDAVRAGREFRNLIDKLALLRPLNQKAMRMIQEVDSSMMEPLVREMFVTGPTSSEVKATLT